MKGVSVIIPAYNCAAYLPQAIDSVLEQNFPDVEVIVVNDGSTDDTAEVVLPYLDRIRYITQGNKGLPAARNTGIRASSKDFIALLDADDFWLPQKLALQMPLFADAEVGIVYSDFSVRYSDGRSLSSYLVDRPLASEGFIVLNYIRSRFLFPSTMGFRRSALEESGLFDEEMLAAEDIELFTRICLRWRVRRVPQALMVRREGTHNITANGEKMSDYTILAFEKVLQREPELSEATRRTIQIELGRQHWWRGYASYKKGLDPKARRDLFRAMRLDRSYVRKAAPLLLASLMPPSFTARFRV